MPKGKEPEPLTSETVRTVRIAFWNSHGFGQPPLAESAAVVARIFAEGASVVGLCEVSEDFLAQIGKVLGDRVAVIRAPVTTSTGLAKWGLA